MNLKSSLSNLPEEMGKKFGLASIKEGDEELIEEYLNYLEDHQLDFTNSFRALSSLESDNDSFLKKLINRLGKEDGGVEGAKKLMLSNNPYLVPRNHQSTKGHRPCFKG